MKWWIPQLFILWSMAQCFADYTTAYHILLQVGNYTYRPPMKLREGKVFTGVCLSFYAGGRGSPCDHYPWCIEPHCTGPLPSPGPLQDMGTPLPRSWPPPDVGHGDLLVTSVQAAPPVLTSGDDRSTFRSTGMLSCSDLETLQDKEMMSSSKRSSQANLFLFNQGQIEVDIGKLIKYSENLKFQFGWRRPLVTIFVVSHLGW